MTQSRVRKRDEKIFCRTRKFTAVGHPMSSACNKKV